MVAPVNSRAMKAKAALSAACVAMLLYAAELLVRESPEQEKVESLYQQLAACRDAFDAHLAGEVTGNQAMRKEA